MKIKLLTPALLFVCAFCFSQEYDKVTYYSDKYARNEVEKGNFRITERIVNDSILEMEFVNVKKNRKQWIKYYLNDQPYGIWKYYDKKGVLYNGRNYEFVLRYGEYIPEGVYNLGDLKENPTQNFEMPLLNNANGKEGIDLHVRNMFRYPEIAHKQNIQGRVLAQFTIDKEGKVKNLSIVESAGEPLDREFFLQCLIGNQQNLMESQLRFIFNIQFLLS